MRRSMSLVMALVASVTIFANVPGHFFMHVENENVPLSQVESRFSRWQIGRAHV